MIFSSKCDNMYLIVVFLHLEFLEAKLYKKIVNTVYLINIIIQSFVSLLFPIAVAVLAAWYLAEQR